MGLDNKVDEQVIRVCVVQAKNQGATFWLDTSKETKCQRSGAVEYFQQEPREEPKAVANDSGVCHLRGPARKQVQTIPFGVVI